MGLPPSAGAYTRTTPRGKPAISCINAQLARVEDVIRSRIPRYASGAALHLDVESDASVRYEFHRLVELLTVLNPFPKSSLYNTLRVLQGQLRRAFIEASTGNTNRVDVLTAFNQRWLKIAEDFIRNALRTPITSGELAAGEFRPHDPLPRRGTQIIRHTISAAVTDQPTRLLSAETEQRRRLEEYAKQRLTIMITTLERILPEKSPPAVIFLALPDMAQQYARAYIATKNSPRQIVGYIEQAAIKALSSTYQHYRDPQVLTSTYDLSSTLRQNFTQDFHRYIGAIETHMKDVEDSTSRHNPTHELHRYSGAIETHMNDVD